MKIFLFGSCSIKYIPFNAQRMIFNDLNKGHTFLIGDAPGVDSAWQDFLHDTGYQDVEIHTSGNTPRYVASLSGNENVHLCWSIKNLNLSQENFSTESEYLHKKDIAMISACDAAIVVWDGKSRTTKQNIDALIELGKPITVFIEPSISK